MNLWKAWIPWWGKWKPDTKPLTGIRFSENNSQSGLFPVIILEDPIFRLIINYSVLWSQWSDINTIDNFVTGISTCTLSVQNCSVISCSCHTADIVVIRYRCVRAVCQITIAAGFGHFPSLHGLFILCLILNNFYMKQNLHEERP